VFAATTRAKRSCSTARTLSPIGPHHS
jgi:hypothetical protein